MRIRKNESSAAARTMFVVVYTVDGDLAAPEAVPASMLYYDPGSGVMAAASGTWAPRAKSLAFAADTFTAVAATDVATTTTVDLQTGDGPVTVSNSGGALPGGLAPATNYWWIRTGVKTGKFASSLANALAGVAIDITTNGTGVQTLSSSGATRRCMRGQFLYTFTQAETNVGAPYISITVSDDNTTIRTAEQTADIWVRAFDDQGNSAGRTYGDMMRMSYSSDAGPNINYPPDGAAGSVDYKDPDTGQTRMTIEITATGRGTSTPGDLT